MCLLVASRAEFGVRRQLYIIGAICVSCLVNQTAERDFLRDGPGWWPEELKFKALRPRDPGPVSHLLPKPKKLGVPASYQTDQAFPGRVAREKSSQGSVSSQRWHSLHQGGAELQRCRGVHSWRITWHGLSPLPANTAFGSSPGHGCPWDPELTVRGSCISGAVTPPPRSSVSAGVLRTKVSRSGEGKR